MVKELVEEGNKHLEELKNIDSQILAVQKSTKTSFSFFTPVHNYCRTQYDWYYNWHIKPYATKIHTGVLTLVLLSSLGIASSSILSFPNTGKANIDFAPEVAEKMVDYSKIYASVPADATEIVEKRTANQKVFRLNDGQERYIISGGPLHYKATNGKYYNIESNIEPSADGNSFVMNKSIYSANFGKNFLSDPLVDIAKDNQNLTVRPKELSFSSPTDNQPINSPQSSDGILNNPKELVYKNAYGEGLDFAYETQDLQLKKKLNIASLESLPTPTIGTKDQSDKRSENHQSPVLL